MKTALRFMAGAFGAVVLSWMAAASAPGAVIYESSGGTGLLGISDFGFTHVGDSVSVVGDDLRVGSAVVPFNTRTHTATVAYTPAFLRLTLYEDEGGLPGAVIASSTVPGPAFPAGGNSATGGTPVTFMFDDVEVPDTFVFGIAQLNADLEPETSSSTRFNVFLSQMSLPDIGTSPDTFLFESGGEWAADDFGQAPAQVDITFNTPLPEPGAVVILLLAGLALARRPRRG